MPSRSILYTFGHVRGHAFCDPLHRRRNRWHLTRTLEGIHNKWDEAALIMSFKKGPWLGAAHCWQLQTAKTYAFGLGVKDPVYVEFYPYICRCRYANNMRAAYGTEEHVCET